MKFRSLLNEAPGGESIRLHAAGVQRFLPAFRDTRTGKVYTTGYFHDLDSLPEDVRKHVEGNLVGADGGFWDIERKKYLTREETAWLVVSIDTHSKKFDKRQEIERRKYKREEEKHQNKGFQAQLVGEMIEIPIEVGQTILGGKFLNKKIVVKKIGKNEHGDWQINGKPLLRFRIPSSKSQIEESSVMKFGMLKERAFPQKNFELLWSQFEKVPFEFKNVKGQDDFPKYNGLRFSLSTMGKEFKRIFEETYKTPIAVTFNLTNIQAWEKNYSALRWAGRAAMNDDSFMGTGHRTLVVDFYLNYPERFTKELLTVYEEEKWRGGSLAFSSTIEQFFHNNPEYSGKNVVYHSGALNEVIQHWSTDTLPDIKNVVQHELVHYEQQALDKTPPSKRGKGKAADVENEVWNKTDKSSEDAIKTYYGLKDEIAAYASEMAGQMFDSGIPIEKITDKKTLIDVANKLKGEQFTQYYIKNDDDVSKRFRKLLYLYYQEMEKMKS